MNLQAYITSGILELYVHGLASPEEIREVEAMEAQYPEIKQELETIRQVLESYASTFGVEPPAGLKDKVMNRLEGVPGGHSRTKFEEPNNIKPNIRNYTPTPDNATTSRVSWILGFALLGASIAALLFWQQGARANDQLKNVEAQTEQLRKECEEAKAASNKVKDQFIAIRQIGTLPVQMKPTPLGGDALAVVYWNSKNKTSYLDVVKLPKPAPDKQFQLWAIVDGKPTDMGVFEVAAADSMQSVPFIPNPQAFAVTLEPKGGSESPSLDQMYVMGALKS